MDPLACPTVQVLRAVSKVPWRVIAARVLQGLVPVVIVDQAVVGAAEVAEGAVVEAVVVAGMDIDPLPPGLRRPSQSAWDN